MNNPVVSIVLANLNGRTYLAEAIESAVEQTFKDWELIIVDTGSRDGSPGCITEWATRESRIKPVLLETVLNYPTAINHGLRHCRGDYIARLESDDLWLPGKLERQIAFLNAPENQGIGVCGTDVILVDLNGRTIAYKRFPRTHEACLSAIWHRNPLCHSTTVARREVFENAGGYDEGQYLVEDLDLWFRVMPHWNLANLPEPLSRYRVWDGSLSEKRIAEIARRTRKLRRAAARQYGIPFTWRAWIAYCASYAAGIIPPKWTRLSFQWFIDNVDDLGEESTHTSSGYARHRLHSEGVTLN